MSDSILERVYITNQQILAKDTSGFSSNPLGMDVALLLCLKELGAPVIGNILLRPDMENYNWSHYKDELGHIVQWRNIK